MATKTGTDYEQQLRRVERHRWQLWFLSLVLLVLFAVTIFFLSYFDIGNIDVGSILNIKIVRYSLLFLTLGFVAYIVERESILKKMSRRILEEQINTANKTMLFEQSKQTAVQLAALNKELKEKNDALKKSYSSIKKINKELERFNRLTVNRELQMIKLKEKIKELEKK
ncbi:MAG: hypothetical protein C4562_06400 [Actinobacteria bacterium]|nr:MAG: hypothetical protein C4562_06400 [Actinomycetota bacterium]